MEKLGSVLLGCVVVARDSLDQNGKKLEPLRDRKACYTLLYIKNIEMTDQGQLATLFELLKQGSYWELDFPGVMSDR
jgi:hypothetical protein